MVGGVKAAITRAGVDAANVASIPMEDAGQKGTYSVSSMPTLPQVWFAPISMYGRIGFRRGREGLSRGMCMLNERVPYVYPRCSLDLVRFSQ